MNPHDVTLKGPRREMTRKQFLRHLSSGQNLADIANIVDLDEDWVHEHAREMWGLIDIPQEAAAERLLEYYKEDTSLAAYISEDPAGDDTFTVGSSVSAAISVGEEIRPLGKKAEQRITRHDYLRLRAIGHVDANIAKRNDLSISYLKWLVGEWGLEGVTTESAFQILEKENGVPRPIFYKKHHGPVFLGDPVSKAVGFGAKGEPRFREYLYCPNCEESTRHDETGRCTKCAPCDVCQKMTPHSFTTGRCLRHTDDAPGCKPDVDILSDFKVPGGEPTLNFMMTIMDPLSFRGFLIGEALKRVARAAHEFELEEVKKAAEYLDFLIKDVEQDESDEA